mgnify:CR=1 FL=1
MGIIFSIIILLMFDKFNWIEFFGKYASEEFSYIGSFLSGITGPLFGILSFIGIILTILYQVKTNKLSREEQSLFELLKNQSEIVKSTVIDLKNYRKEGRDCYSYLYRNKFKAVYNYQLNSLPSQGHNKRIRDAFDLFFSKQRIHFEHNFRSITTILKYINTSELPDKKEKVKILSSQLSEYEILLFFYYGLSDKCDSKLKKIIIDLEFFSYLPVSELLNDDHINEYNASE